MKLNEKQKARLAWLAWDYVATGKPKAGFVRFVGELLGNTSAEMCAFLNAEYEKQERNYYASNF